MTTIVTKLAAAIAVLGFAGGAWADQSGMDRSAGSHQSTASSGATTKRSCDGLRGAEKARCMRDERGTTSNSKFGMDVASGKNAGYAPNPSSSSKNGGASEGGGSSGGDGSGAGH